MTNYFEFFGLPESWDIDQQELKQKYYANSRSFHPDRHRLGDEAEQTEALENSSHNNRGYKLLLDEQSRLRHLLEVKDAMPPEGDNKLPQDFLMEVMELNEAAMELSFDPDPAASTNFIAQLDTFREQLEGEVTDLRKSQNLNAQQLDRLRNYYLKRKYLNRLEENLPQ
ncbi:MAG: iron-sulfur cluster co-chaperone HscB C-terminal domain-containing protein [Bacteroidota bacterium]